MAVALRDLDQGRRHRRRPSLRVVDARARPATPRRVYWLRRLMLLLLVGVLVIAGIVATRVLVADTAPTTTRFEMTVVMPPGGTLWDLAALYAPGEDRAAWASAVAERNAVDPATIRPGTPLTVPVETRRVSAQVHGAVEREQAPGR